MYLLHNIGPKINSNYNTRDDILCKQNETFSFDGIYLNVWENRDLFSLIKSPILFVMGNYIGKDNSFDAPMPLEKYCDWWHLMDLVTNFHCQLGWHTWSHRDLTQLSDDELLKEVTPPFPMNWFAYPYGKLDDRVVEMVRSVNCYDAAWSVNQGNGSQYQLNRQYL